MLGRSAGIPDDKLANVARDPLPDDVYSPDEAAIIRYARASTRLEPITDALYRDLASHFDDRRVIAICMTVGLSNVVNRFHATFLTDVDEASLDQLADAPPLPLPPMPGR